MIRLLVSVCLLSVCLLFISLSVRPYLDFSEVLRFARNSSRGNSTICKNDKKTIHAGFSYRRKVLGEGGRSERASMIDRFFFGQNIWE